MTDIQFYTHQSYRCAYEHIPGQAGATPLLLIHPIGVGLAGWFWHRFGRAAGDRGWPYPIYNPDLLGCGHSDKPTLAYYPQDWADQLATFLRQVVKTPVVLVVQGAVCPLASSCWRIRRWLVGLRG